MDAGAAFGRANVHYVNEEYDEALQNYTQAISLQDCVEYRSCRAACQLKLGRFEETLEDASEALKLDPKNSQALYWKGIALFYLADFLQAKASLEESLLCDPAKATRSLWIRKCDAELSGSSLPLVGVTAELSKASKPVNQISPSAPVPAAPAAPAAAPAVVTPAPAPAETPTEVIDRDTPLSITGRKPVKREWYQNATHVFITLFAKGVAEESLKVDLQQKEIAVSFPLPGGSSDEEYQLNLDLHDDIVPSKSKVEVSRVKVEVILEKKNPQIKWRDLERKEQILETPPDQPEYPTSNKSKRNWSQIDREIEELTCYIALACGAGTLDILDLLQQVVAGTIAVHLPFADHLALNLQAVGLLMAPICEFAGSHLAWGCYLTPAMLFEGPEVRSMVMDPRAYPQMMSAYHRQMFHSLPMRMPAPASGPGADPMRTRMPPVEAGWGDQVASMIPMGWPGWPDVQAYMPFAGGYQVDALASSSQEQPHASMKRRNSVDVACAECGATIRAGQGRCGTGDFFGCVYCSNCWNVWGSAAA